MDLVFNELLALRRANIKLHSRRNNSKIESDRLTLRLCQMPSHLQLAIPDPKT